MSSVGSQSDSESENGFGGGGGGCGDDVFVIPLELSTGTGSPLVNAVSADDEVVEAVNLHSLQRRLLRRLDHHSHRQWGVQDDDSVIDSPETIMTHGRRLQQDTAA